MGRVDEIFLNAFSKESQLIKVDPRLGKYLACALMARGQFSLTDIRRNIER
jgi:tubulin epsilon